MRSPDIEERLGGIRGSDEETLKRGVWGIRKVLKEAGDWKEDFKKLREEVKKEMIGRNKKQEEMLKRGLDEMRRELRERDEKWTVEREVIQR